ncbi:MAG: transposase [Chloroflexi bacterium]|nr:transposase [Chloroflexota bacterium]
MLRDWEEFVTFYQYPEEHWTHLRTTNPLESIFGGVRGQTNSAKRLRRRDNARYLIREQPTQQFFEFDDAFRESGGW